MTYRIISSLILSLFTFTSVSPVIAADLTYLANTTIVINGMNFIVAMNSGASTITIGATTLTVNVPSGASFLMRGIAPNAKATLSNNGGIQSDCSSTDNSLTVLGAKEVIITPSTTECVPTATTSSSSPAPVPVQAPSTTTTTTAKTTAPTTTTTTPTPSTTAPSTPTGPALTVPIVTAPVVTAQTPNLTPQQVAEVRAAQVVAVKSEASEIVAVAQTVVSGGAPAAAPSASGAAAAPSAPAPIVSAPPSAPVIQIINNVVPDTATPQQAAAAIKFIADGTSTTKVLGAGERAAVLNSYIEAFDDFPETQADWEDLLKIAIGRYPSQRSAESEKEAAADFRDIYRRAPNREKNVNDDAAVMIMAYGLQPFLRNTKSEQAAIRIYRGIFKKSPKGARAWNIVRTIAYSGARR